MSIRRSLVGACGAAGLGLLMATWGYAASSSRTMYLSFNGPIALPGVTLAAGTYTFERALPGENVSVVRISSRDRKKVYLTTFTQLVRRPDGLPADRYVVLGEPTRGVPPPIKAWFPAGEPQG